MNKFYDFGKLVVLLILLDNYYLYSTFEVIISSNLSLPLSPTAFLFLLAYLNLLPAGLAPALARSLSVIFFFTLHWNNLPAYSTCTYLTYAPKLIDIWQFLAKPSQTQANEHILRRRHILFNIFESKN